MHRIEELLENLFKYKRDSRPEMETLVKQGYDTKGVSHLNIRVENKESHLYGIIPFVFPDSRKGNILGFYTAERNLSKEGPKLLEPFEQFNDCPYVHYGVLMNCLAFMSPTRINELRLVQMEGVDVVTFKLRPDLAEMFIQGLSQESAKDVTKTRVMVSQVVQSSLFAA